MGGGIAFSIVVFILIVLILICIAMIISNMVRPKLVAEDIPPCEPVEFCTKDERNFYIDLMKIAKKQNLLVFSKVGLGCVLKPRRGVDQRDKWSQHLRGEYADFVLCDPETLKTLIVIMLDDSVLALQKTSLGMVDKACERAGVPIIHVREYNLPGLEKALTAKMAPRKISAKSPIKNAKEEQQEQPA